MMDCSLMYSNEAGREHTGHRSAKEAQCAFEEYVDRRTIWIFYWLGGVAKFEGVLENKVIFSTGQQDAARSQ